MLVRAQEPAVLAHAPAKPGTSRRSETVSAVIPVKSPEMENLDLTLGSLERQTHQPAEVVVVDCMRPPVSIEADLPVGVLPVEECGIPRQRRSGVRHTSSDVVLHLDEDAVLTRPDHIERALEQLEDPGVSAVGGTIAPLRGNFAGQLASSLTPVKAWFPMHNREACPDGRECFPEDGSPPFYNDDRMLKRRLGQVGEVVEDRELVVLTELPTRKQTAAAVGATGLAALFL